MKQNKCLDRQAPSDEWQYKESSNKELARVQRELREAARAFILKRRQDRLDSSALCEHARDGAESQCAPGYCDDRMTCVCVRACVQSCKISRKQ